MVIELFKLEKESNLLLTGDFLIYGLRRYFGGVPF